MSMSSMQPSCRRTRRSNGRIGSSPRLPAIHREWSRWMARCWTSLIFAQLRKFWRHAAGSQDLGSISAPSAIHPGFEHELDEIVALRKEVGDAQLDRVRCCWIDGCEEEAITDQCPPNRAHIPPPGNLLLFQMAAHKRIFASSIARVSMA